ncbi:aldolase/citrate lyase family protein [Actinoplanes sp. NPDC049802]|uniref:HpcH/HpaI aldolase family protein n=1 Tax=Actinoplanes sp. NPDC049802 TaxID=3154742 RepID=UPI0034030460
MNVDGTIAARSSHRLRAGWARGTPAFGLWSSIPDTSVAELVAGSPFDYVCVDLQHGVPTFTELPVMLQVMRAAGRAPIVRVPWKDPVAIMRALDTGACGVLVPMIDSAADAERAVAACRFPPAGQRSWGPMWGYTRTEGVPSPAAQDAAVLCIVMVETRAGVDALEQIVRVPGVDAVYIGPNDLALDCGYGRATYRDSPDVEKLLDHIITTCRSAGTAVGLHCSDLEMGEHWARRGAGMLTVAQDTGLLQAALDATWTRLHPAG